MNRGLTGKRLSADERAHLDWVGWDKDYDPEALSPDYCREVVKRFNGEYYVQTLPQTSPELRHRIDRPGGHLAAGNAFIYSVSESCRATAPVNTNNQR